LDGHAQNVARDLGVDPLELILHGGEDYALIVTCPSPIDGFRRIGVVEAGDGVWLARGATREPLAPRGYDHFA
jgi:thiamine monophosphate kinase